MRYKISCELDILSLLRHTQVTQTVGRLPYSRGNMPENIEREFRKWFDEMDAEDLDVMSRYNYARAGFIAGYYAAQQSTHPTCGTLTVSTSYSTPEDDSAPEVLSTPPRQTMI